MSETISVSERSPRTGPFPRSGTMTCPACEGDDTTCIDTRPTAEGLEIRRRRGCRSCDHRWTTYERTDDAMAYGQPLIGDGPFRLWNVPWRSGEHTSQLQTLTRRS